MTPRLSLAFVLLISAAVAATLPGPLEIQPLPDVVRFAQAHVFSLAPVVPAGPAEEAVPGDRLTVLFTIQQNDGSMRQWLAEFRAAALTASEAKSKPGSGLGLLSVFQAALRTDTGHEYSFPQVPAALELHTCGPFPATGEVPEVKTRVLATRAYLAHGLAPMAEIELRLRAAGKQYPVLSFMFLTRFSDEQIAATTARAQAAGFTVEDERTFAEGLFALVQFGNLAFRTEGIDAITREMLDSPGLFSGAIVNLDWTAAQLENGTDWGLPGGRVFRVPYTLQSKTQANGTLFITASHPPLQNMAGIIGATIDWSSKTPGKRLILRVLAGQRGAQ